MKLCARVAARNGDVFLVLILSCCYTSIPPALNNTIWHIKLWGLKLHRAMKPQLKYVGILNQRLLCTLTSFGGSLCLSFRRLSHVFFVLSSPKPIPREQAKRKNRGHSTSNTGEGLRRARCALKYLQHRPFAGGVFHADCFACRDDFLQLLAG